MTCGKDLTTQRELKDEPWTAIVTASVRQEQKSSHSPTKRKRSSESDDNFEYLSTDDDFEDLSTGYHQSGVHSPYVADDYSKCVVTGHTTTETCHIIPISWTAEPEVFQESYSRLFDSNSHLQWIFEPTIFPKAVDFGRYLVPSLGFLNKPWNTLVIEEALHAMWIEAKWAFKYTGHMPSLQANHVDVSLQFEWLGVSSVKVSDAIDMTRLDALDTKLLLKDMDFSMENNVPPCNVKNGLMINITIPEEDVDIFILAIELQYAILRIASLCAAGQAPDDLPDYISVRGHEDGSELLGDTSSDDVMSQVSAWTENVAREMAKDEWQVEE